AGPGLGRGLRDGRRHGAARAGVALGARRSREEQAMRVARWCRLPLAATVLGLVMAGPAHAQYQAPVEYLPPRDYQGPVPYRPPAPTRAPTQAEDVLFSFLATATNIFYVPLKFAIAPVALPPRGIAGGARGGAAPPGYPHRVPAPGGTLVPSPAH